MLEQLSTNMVTERIEKEHLLYLTTKRTHTTKITRLKRMHLIETS